MSAAAVFLREWCRAEPLSLQYAIYPRTHSRPVRRMPRQESTTPHFIPICLSELTATALAILLPTGRRWGREYVPPCHWCLPTSWTPIGSESRSNRPSVTPGTDRRIPTGRSRFVVSLTLCGKPERPHD